MHPLHPKKHKTHKKKMGINYIIVENVKNRIYIYNQDVDMKKLVKYKK